MIGEGFLGYEEKEGTAASAGLGIPPVPPLAKSRRSLRTRQGCVVFSQYFRKRKQFTSEKLQKKTKYPKSQLLILGLRPLLAGCSTMGGGGRSANIGTSPMTTAESS